MWVVFVADEVGEDGAVDFLAAGDMGFWDEAELGFTAMVLGFRDRWEK